MKNQLEWQERYNIGVDIIDKEHKKLFAIMNRLLIASKNEKKIQWVCQEGIKYFRDHAMKHFTEEEAYMASINYAGFDTHRRLHDNFRKKTLPELERELMRTCYSADAISHFLGVCAGWLIGHTLTEDRAITGDKISRWRDLLPDEEQAAMRKTIIQLLNDLFQLNAKVLSECYGGEKFGDGIYYRLVYGNKDNDRWEIILVFEEKVIVNTIGIMMDVNSDSLSVMMVNAARYTAQQFVNSIKEHYPSADLDEVIEENLLTYEQFQRIFDNNRPQFSLLFDTGEGYFAFCAIAPHLMQRSGEIPIKEENAMDEIRNYLNKNALEKKKKILVVDDSDIALEAMKNLLESDYEVTLANSGLAAIRCITLNKPDLVLLDYEMPVCDGSQVLEMIRAEEDFANIPIFFLTGRGDRESVTKLIALKPSGYMVKTLPPEEIKNGIDNYLSGKNNN